MSDKLTLTLENRTLFGKKVGRLRRAGIMPATVYGKGVDPISVQVDARTFSDTYRRSGRTKLIELTLTGQKKQSAFVHTVQRHPVTRAITHADFLVVDLKTEITVEVPVHIVGESPLVQQNLAVLNLALSTLAVRALPAELPSHVEADVSGLDSLDKNVHVGDLSIPGGKATIVADPELVVVSITPARVEEEPEETEGAAAEPELVREQRDDEEDAE